MTLPSGFAMTSNMHHSPRRHWTSSSLGFAALGLLLGSGSCSAEMEGGSSSSPPPLLPGTIVESCPAGYLCDQNEDGQWIVVEPAATGGGSGVGGANQSGGAPGSGAGTGVGGSSQDDTCTDIQHPDQSEPCSIWLEWGDPPGAHCNDEWLQGYCDATCGRCTPSSSGGSSSGGSSSGGGSGGSLGGGPSLPNLNDGEVYFATRYWDCCKPHCAWQEHGATAPSCSSNGTSQVSSSTGSACAGESAYTCYSDAPYAVSTTVSYGTIARYHPDASCGQCYHIQFTGEGQHNASDPGSQAIAGKHMIVKATNTGHDVNNKQFDLLIPGGGVGVNPGTCSAQWGQPDGHPEGGYLRDCGGSYEQKKQCVRDKCANLPAGDARDGCNWFVDWYEIADNPKFRFAPINCPADMRF